MVSFSSPYQKASITKSCCTQMGIGECYFLPLAMWPRTPSSISVDGRTFSTFDGGAALTTIKYAKIRVKKPYNAYQARILINAHFFPRNLLQNSNRVYNQDNAVDFQTWKEVMPDKTANIIGWTMNESGRLSMSKVIKILDLRNNLTSSDQ